MNTNEKVALNSRKTTVQSLKSYSGRWPATELKEEKQKNWQHSKKVLDEILQIRKHFMWCSAEQNRRK